MIGGGAFLAASYPVFIERFSIQTNTYQIPVRNLPKSFTGFTIIHLSDLHYGIFMPKSFIQDVICKVNQMDRDIIVNTGDNVYHRRNEQTVDEMWPLLLELNAPLGVYSVLGNHDHWASTERSLEWLEKSGQNLRHRSIAIEKNGSRIWLGGAGDLWEDETGVDLAFKDVPENECKILLAHNPDTADTPFTTTVNLVLSGHTHGGQINIPFIGPPVLPVSNRRYASGFVRSPHTSLFISRGVGSTAPVRFNCPPEIAVLKLVPES
ncbi:MAG: metallophosphoesterase [Chloroflexi bacterium]|nr:metallophosphoesterase [Chloroflexota bacterium]